MSDVDSAEMRRKWVWDQQDALTHQIKVSVSYHAKRERYFALLERLCQALAALAATSAFVDIAGKDTGFAKLFALIAAVASILPLVFGFAEQSRRHGQLKSSFSNLFSDMSKLGLELGEIELAEFKARTARIEAGEPAALGALVIQCENEIAIAEKKKIYPLQLHEKLLMHVYNFDGTAIINRPVRTKSCQ